jgi:type I restriction enzyme, R subunit
MGKPMATSQDYVNWVCSEAIDYRYLKGDDTLKTIARELVATVRKNVTIDWTIRDNVRAQLRVFVKRILRKYGYPPDKQEKATQTVLDQAEVLSEGWAVA